MNSVTAVCAATLVAIHAVVAHAAIGTLDTVRIGRSVFTGVPGVASDLGIVGNGIWSRVVCVFDYAYYGLIIESPAEASVEAAVASSGTDGSDTSRVAGAKRMRTLFDDIQ